MLRRNLDDLATVLHKAGIRKWAVSPGSRNAPIVAGFIRHGGFELFSFPDERCAAYAALGMSQGSDYPCGVICTSGTAVLNLYPGICEAYYQRVPLIVLTADRPPELIDQWDGQTIHQSGIFEKHILASYDLPPNLDSEPLAQEIQEIVYGAVSAAMSAAAGPVHINVPLRDPIYEGMETEFDHSPDFKNFEPEKKQEVPIDLAYLHSRLSEYSSILIVAGQLPYKEYLRAAMRTVSMEFPVLADVTANLHGCSIKGWDLAMNGAEIPENLRPDLLITIGLSVVSKPLKLFLKNNKPTAHWHISTGGFTGDPFDTAPETHELAAEEFMEALTDIPGIANPEYMRLWKNFTESAIPGKSFLSETFQQEFHMVDALLKQLPENAALHLGNSMPVRYASWSAEAGCTILANRGTSGIDGTLSTAVGYAQSQPSRRVFCLLGDMSFLYDSNALWTSPMPHNLGIVVLNNGGGKIFEFISGPENQPSLMQFIKTPHSRSAIHIAEDYGISYQRCNFTAARNVADLLSQNMPFILEFFHE